MSTVGPVREGQYALTQEQPDLRDVIRRIAVERVGPRAAAIDAAGEFPEDVRRLFADQGLLGLPFSEAQAARVPGS